MIIINAMSIKFSLSLVYKNMQYVGVGLIFSLEHKKNVQV